MVLIFDLDDTLYDEMSFVISGLRAVARHGEAAFGWNAAASLAFMQATLREQGRGQVFDEWLRAHGRWSRSQVTRCLGVYRQHPPDIVLAPAALPILQRYQGQLPLYLVTDGHKGVQARKVRALGLEPFFKRIFITHRFGIQHAKPSLHCFDIIRRAERCDWPELVYVGDNPAKDFVSLNQQGALTVRVSTGSHASAVAQPGYDARHTIASLGKLPPALGR